MVTKMRIMTIVRMMRMMVMMTMLPRDMDLARRIRGRSDHGLW